MKKLSKLIFKICFLVACSLASLAHPKSANDLNVPDSLDRILVNQVGYLPGAVKTALLRVKTDKFDIINAGSGKVVFTGKPGSFKYWNFSGDSVATADFTSVNVPGKYQVCINNKTICSYVFEIGNGVYREISKASLKAFYLNRSGTEISKEFGGKWARAAGHPDTAVFVHASAASDKRPEGYKLSSAGGWYDAGDYNKYIVNSSITTYTLLLFCQMYPEYIKSFKNKIPESSNNLSDVIDELLVNLRWMMTMQDPNDGGVYHKLTNKGFGDFSMPDKATEPRYVVYKTTAAALDFAATMSMASRVFAKTDSKVLKELAVTCLDAAKRAYAWAKANPAIYYKNPADISTGAYDDFQLKDEFFWASSELGLAENNVALISKDSIKAQPLIIQSWDASGMLGIISLSLSDNPAAAEYQKEAKKKLLEYADQLLDKSINAPYKVSLDFFKWGSNSDVANMAIIKLVAYKITQDKKYLPSIQGDVDYILGRNATGYCFVTGFGSRQVMNIHHRPSGADGIADPYPGFLSGGPNTVTFADCPNLARSKFPAKSFVDAECSYSTNEIAINWNAPLFFVMGAMDSMTKY
jgi:endoglucanase